MISVTTSNPKFRAINHQPKLSPVISSNCSHSLPYPPFLSTSNPKFGVLKFTPISPFLHTSGFRFPIIHHRYSTKKWKVSCFRHEEFSPSTSNPESAKEILNESDKSEISKPKFERGNWTKSFREIVDGLFRQTGKPWIVPWTANTILQVALLWVVSFWFVGSWMIPFGAHIVGISRASLTFRGQAFFSLLTDVTAGLAGIIILYRCLSPFHPLPPDWFRFSPRGKWLLEVVLGCSMFPLVNRLSQFNLDLLPVLTSTPATLSSVEQSIMARDPIAMALYAVVLVVCAPLWEEIVFRGFLLPSLTRYMPVWCSILVSAVAFALAHFNVQRVIPLIFLGVVMGVTYSRSRNLLPPMLLHSLWNGFVFFDLIK
ncbi:CAAX amino terminal protease family protein [Perilla frutescens var. frutescens]|nr:CAAX amino terminal protease family protein [Perilla frutescens var. frutescens]